MARRHWRFLIPILVQVALLATVPARQQYTREVGTTVFLKLAPVDPFDVLSGHYMTLAYEASRPPGVEALSDGDEVYVRLVESPEGVWDARETALERPADRDPEAVWMRGRYVHRAIQYGIESYFIPEEGREEMEEQLRDRLAESRAEVKVDDTGHAVLIRLHIGDRVY